MSQKPSLSKTTQSVSKAVTGYKRKPLDLAARPGKMDAKRQATWGMSAGLGLTPERTHGFSNRQVSHSGQPL